MTDKQKWYLVFISCIMAFLISAVVTWVAIVGILSLLSQQYRLAWLSSLVMWGGGFALAIVAVVSIVCVIVEITGLEWGK